MPVVEVRAHKRTYLIALHAHFIIPALIAEYGLVFRLNCRGVQFDPFDCLFRKVCELREIEIVLRLSQPLPVQSLLVGAGLGITDIMPIIRPNSSAKYEAQNVWPTDIPCPARFPCGLSVSVELV